MQIDLTQYRCGFTLLEFLVAIIMLAVLATIGIPSYLHYVKKAYYSEIVQAADRYSLAVSVCLRKNQGNKTECSAGENGVPPNIIDGVGQIASIKVINAAITVTPKNINGIRKTDTYVLTPIYRENGIQWVSSGGGCKRHIAPDC